MYLCEVCGTAFDRPLIQSERNGDGESSWEERFALCPICGSHDFQTAESCPMPNCNHFKKIHEILCSSCRKDLLRRFTDFADHLTAEEEQQLDDWLDGDTITNRRNWH